MIKCTIHESHTGKFLSSPSLFKLPELYQLLVLLAKVQLSQVTYPGNLSDPHCSLKREIFVLKTKTCWKLKCLENMKIKDKNKLSKRKFGYSCLSFDSLCWVVRDFQHESKWILTKESYGPIMGINMMVKISDRATDTIARNSNLTSLKNYG